MRQLAIRILKRSIPVALILAVVGYVLADVGLLWMKINGLTVQGGGDEMRWNAALRLPLLGISLLVVCELIAFAVRRKTAQPPTPVTVTTVQPTNP